MHLLSLLALSAPVLAGVLPPPSDSFTTLEARQSFKKKPACVKNGIHLIVGSGAGGAQVAGYGLLNTTMTAIKSVLTATNYSVPFTKTSDPNQLPSAIAGGVQLMTENIQWYAKGCPNTPIVLVGYSEGGMVTMDTLCGKGNNGLPYGTPLDPSYTKNIIAVALYGEETRAAGQSYNTGTCTTGNGEFTRANSAACSPYAPVMKSWCDANDPTCCVAPGSNYNQSIHYTYPASYNQAVAQFISSQYQTWKNNHKSS